MRVEFYRDQSSEWRWRAMAGNNRIIADSGEGYKNYVDCVNGFMLLGGLFDGVNKDHPRSNAS